MTIKKLQILYFSVWVIPILLASIYNLGWFGERVNTCDDATKYLITFILDIMTIIIIYAGVKLMKFKWVNRSITRWSEKAFQRYFAWNVLRYFAFIALILASLYIYMFTSNDSGLYTTLMILCAHVFCYPSEQESIYILNSNNSTEEK